MCVVCKGLNFGVDLPPGLERSDHRGVLEGNSHMAGAQGSLDVIEQAQRYLEGKGLVQGSLERDH